MSFRKIWALLSRDLSIMSRRQSLRRALFVYLFLYTLLCTALYGGLFAGGLAVRSPSDLVDRLVIGQRMLLTLFAPWVTLAWLYSFPRKELLEQSLGWTVPLPQLVLSRVLSALALNGILVSIGLPSLILAASLADLDRPVAARSLELVCLTVLLVLPAFVAYLTTAREIKALLGSYLLAVPIFVLSAKLPDLQLHPSGLIAICGGCLLLLGLPAHFSDRLLSTQRELQ